MEAAMIAVDDQHRAAARRYPMTVCADDDGFRAELPDWPHLVGLGETPEAALEDALEAVAAALALRGELGQPAPRPLAGRSGRVVLHLPASLHRALDARAAAEGVSLDATAAMLLVRALTIEPIDHTPRGADAAPA